MNRTNNIVTELYDIVNFIEENQKKFNNMNGERVAVMIKDEILDTILSNTED